jgi:copper chaperone CopZ
MAMVDTITISVGGMTCEGCSGRVRDGLLSVTGVLSAEVSHETGTAVVQHDNISKDLLNGAVKAIGYTVDGEGDEYHWKDSSVWRQSASNTKWCLIGCSIGDFGTIAFFQFVLTDVSWPTMNIMLLAMFNGLMTSIALETVILSKQLALVEAFKTACGMSLISMISMEAAMNVVDIMMTGGAMLTWYTIPPMLIIGFLTPWPYNYWRLKKYGVACH